MHIRWGAVPALVAATAGPAFAQAADPAQPFTVGGSAAILSDYRLRGVSQTDEDMAVQAGVTLAHRSGAYAGAWASNLSGWGTFGGANMELDLIGGYRRPLGANGTIDVGLTWYMYPGGADESDYAEPYVKVSGTRGPFGLTAGVAYAPPQQALGRWYESGASAAAGLYDDPGDKEDNLYLWGDGALKLAGTPLSLKAHVGRSEGNRGLGPNATSAAPTGTYWDWSLGVDAAWRNLTLNLSYVDTDIGRREAALLQPSFSRGQDGAGSIADPALVASLTASF
ncbi:TorF family putative porin [Sphingosinicella sp. BN140058]|uniref:TorF family putative porin n=1 Tax=Sphingosinicella sp. BN140058 TaxID=1892855 RepID=UPI0010139C10|nr:TorF family putative porin [Sphingosinicella sp. BN140058]QAY78387.1 hypothetical protein ETR14_18990 [Sphingosinicella sp. BN140058]